MAAESPGGKRGTPMDRFLIDHDGPALRVLVALLGFAASALALLGIVGFYVA